jgi:olfactory receptor
MTPRRCTLIFMAAWIICFIHSLVQMVFVVNLPFCGPNVLDRFYCASPLLIKPACPDT